MDGNLISHCRYMVLEQFTAAEYPPQATQPHRMCTYPKGIIILCYFDNSNHLLNTQHGVNYLIPQNMVVRAVMPTTAFTTSPVAGIGSLSTMKDTVVTWVKENKYTAVAIGIAVVGVIAYLATEPARKPAAPQTLSGIGRRKNKRHGKMKLVGLS